MAGAASPVRTTASLVESPALESGLPASVTPPPAAAPAVRPAPWDAADIFPPKPADADYGWRSHPCTREELIERCRSAAAGRQFVELVWTPDAPRMVPPAEVPWLIEPL